MSFGRDKLCTLLYWWSGMPNHQVNYVTVCFHLLFSILLLFAMYSVEVLADPHSNDKLEKKSFMRFG
uniref:Uncharacterized protein n=1 Tax=Trichobilharzia regenti TaxID=157069 RepID=A0AA85KC15_TRIRE|nr:unnamed protein product [Trichobilharzia regenti]